MPVYHHDLVDEVRRLLKSYVEDGAMYLDKVHAGWYHSIDESMSMSDNHKRPNDGTGGDVLVQVSGMSQPEATLNLLTAEMINDDAHKRLGFFVPKQAYDELLPLVQKFNLWTSHTNHIERVDPFALAYEILTDLWQEEVESRVSGS